jgi:hypothetical protein
MVEGIRRIGIVVCVTQAEPLRQNIWPTVEPHLPRRICTNWYTYQRNARADR